MKPKGTHSSNTAIDKQSRAFFANGKIYWSISQPEIWSLVEKKIELRPTAKVISLNMAVAKWAVAAVITVLISAGYFLRYYSTTITTPAAKHQIVNLPDGSTVKLNAQSTLSYNPYWWGVQRKVKLEGEGFFEVKKGKSFMVVSEKGMTTVLGTSFNIFARDNIYKVICLTGSVEVKSKNGQKAILNPNCKAEIGTEGSIKVSSNVEPLPEISWTNNLFLFTASPIYKVFDEIERQYAVKIHFKSDNYSLYTGNFSRNQNIEDVLQYICPAMGLKFSFKSVGEYIITQEDE